MKKKYFLLFFFLYASLIHGQNVKFEASGFNLNKADLSYDNSGKFRPDTNKIPETDNKSNPDTNFKAKTDSSKTLPVNPDTTKTGENKQFIDSTKLGKYGYLLDDDPQYNKKAPLWRPIVGTIVGNLFTSALDRYILRTEWSKISFQTIKNNWENGWEWDTDRFGINFFQHPYGGAMGFNHARVEGYNFWESVPFAFGSSLMWEQFMENSRPSYNDLINTTISGSLMGEVFYRLSSSFLDDRITGSKRVLREIIAGIIDPVRFVNRLISGKLTRVTNKDIYQREPLQASLFTGVRNINHGTKFWNGNNSAELTFNFSYGDPLENRDRKPYDYFKFRMGLSFGAGKKIVNNLMGYGILTGKNVITKKTGLLYGLFQTYDYWDNNIYELGTLGIGGGLIHRINIGKHSDITSHVHLGIIPMAGIKVPFDSIGERNYNYAGGLEAILEASVNLGGWANISASYFLYGVHVYVGEPGNYIVGIFRPRIAVKVFKDVYLGFEFLQYGKDGYLTNLPDIHERNNEQRIFISVSGGYFGIP